MIADFHNDVLTSLRRQELLREYSASDNEIVCAFFKGRREFSLAYAVCKEFVKTKTDNLHLAFEDISYTEDLSALQALLSLKPVYVTLTWNDENAFGGGAHSTGDLTLLGKTLIGMLNSDNISVDLAHANERTFFAALDEAASPICSHACFSAVNANRRNISREMISRLVERKGLIGLTFYKDFLTDSPECTAEDVCRHIDYFCQRFPHKLLAIGSDFNGCEDLPVGMRDYSFEPLLRERLSARGYGERAIDDIFYNNLHEFLARDRK